MKIAYVGDFINHGKSLQTFGTSIVILLSLLENVDSIDVFCPNVNQDTEEFDLPPKVKIRELYRYDDTTSILRLLKIPWKNYSIVVFDMLPTGFGNGTIANASALLVPILLVKFLRQKNIKMIYHNSVLTNDIKTLGYNSSLDGIRSFFLGIVEKSLFKNLDTFVLLDLYKKRIDEYLGKNRVRVLKSRYLEAITSLYINKVMNSEYLQIDKAGIPTILMHGAWGPQKNIEVGLSELKKLKEEGTEFKLVISGGFNQHFPEYKKKFNELLLSYSDIISEYIGIIDERMIMKLFLESDLVILPYKTPGGHSGVLEQAIFFEVPTIAMDFPEYREQAKGFPNVRLVSPELIKPEVLGILSSRKKKSKIIIHQKIYEIAKSQVRLLL